MIPDRDYYADKNGKLTENPDEYAQQIGVKGCLLDDRIARRYGIADTLVSTAEPNAVRRVTGRNAASVQINKAADKAPATEAKPKEQPQEPADAAESKAESEPEAVATGQDKAKTTAKKEK